MKYDTFARLSKNAMFKNIDLWSVQCYDADGDFWSFIQ